MAVTAKAYSMQSGTLVVSGTDLTYGVGGVHNPSYSHLIVNIHVTVIVGGTTLVVTPQATDPNGNIYVFPGCALTITATGDYQFYAGPGLQVIPNQSYPLLLPDNVNLGYTVGGGGASVTFAS